MSIIYTLSILLSLAYIGIMCRYIYHWQKLKIWETPVTYQPSTKISVIIPVRNEADNIKACLASVLHQDYPSELFELIIIDDHSTDETPDLLAAEQDQRLKVLKLADYIDATQANSFKKKAIEIAVDMAKGDLIATTDGDCIVPERWLQRLAHLYETKGLKFIAAPVNFYQEQNTLEYFQSIDFTGMMGVTGAGIQGQFMNMCNGANLAYDKSAFYEVKGFTGIDHLASGDDMLLMQKIARRFPGQLAYLKNKAATIQTKAQNNWTAFFNQRIRWASKSSDYKEWQTRFFDRQDLMKHFLSAQILHTFYIISVGTLSLFIKNYQWKGRAVR